MEENSKKNPNKNPHKHTKAQRNKIQAMVIEMISRGVGTHIDIAKAIMKAFKDEGVVVEVSRQTVSDIWNKQKRAWYEENKDKIDELMARQLTRLDELEAAYWNLYESKEPKQIQTRVTSKTGRSSNKARKTQEDSAITDVGITAADTIDTKIFTFRPKEEVLERIFEIVKETSKLLGLYKDKVELSGRVEVSNPFEGMSDTELLRWIAENTDKEKEDTT
jgi:hypothetical protein